MWMRPKKYIRNDDGEEFTLNEDEDTYSLEMMKREFPANHHMKWREEQFPLTHFSPVY
jgi:hypothetical protein